MPQLLTRSYSPRLIEQLDQCLRASRYTPRAVETYVHWVRGYICFHHFRHPANMGAKEIRLFLAYLINEHGISTTTYIHALCALLFLYKKLLKIDIGWIDSELHPYCPGKGIVKNPREQLEIPLAGPKTGMALFIDSSPLQQARRTKNKIVQKRSYAPGNENSCRAA